MKIGPFLLLAQTISTLSSRSSPESHLGDQENRRDRRKAANKTGKRQVVVVMREREGSTRPFIVKSEAEGVALVENHVSPDTVVHADEASHWDRMHAGFDTRRINHSEAYSTDLACTNMAESDFSRLCRAEIGIRHRRNRGDGEETHRSAALNE